MNIQHSDEPLPDEEDIYGVNEINEYDSDYWMPDELRARRRAAIRRAVAALLVLAFAALAIYWRWW